MSVDTWDTDAIDQRQRELSKWIFDIWYFPGEAAPVEGAAVAEAPAAEDETAALEQLPEVPCGVRKSGSHAARPYSWISPPSRSRRSTRSDRDGVTTRSVGRSWWGGTRLSARCGRWPL